MNLSGPLCIVSDIALTRTGTEDVRAQSRGGSVYMAEIPDAEARFFRRVRSRISLAALEGRALCGAMPSDTLAERLRRQAAQLMGLSRVRSSPTGLARDDPAAKPAWRPKTKQRGAATSQGSQRRVPAMAPASTRLVPRAVQATGSEKTSKSLMKSSAATLTHRDGRARGFADLCRSAFRRCARKLPLPHF